MKKVVIAYPNEKIVHSLRRMLAGNQFCIAAVCSTGAAALKEVEWLDSAILICPAILPDMPANHLAGMLSMEFEVVALAQSGQNAIGYSSNLTVLNMPLSGRELMRTLCAIANTGLPTGLVAHPEGRSAEDQEAVDQAKFLLMERLKYTEGQAHRYLQKLCMDAGEKMAQTAREILRQYS